MKIILNNFEYQTTVADGMIYYIPQTSHAPAIEPHPLDEMPAAPAPLRKPPKKRRKGKPLSKVYRWPAAQQRAVDNQQVKPLLPEMPVPKVCKYASGIKYRRTAQGWFSISQSWHRLFTVNEYLPPAQKMTDGDLLGRMYEWFPKHVPGEPYASKRFSDVKEMRRRFNQSRLGDRSVYSYEYVRDHDRVFVFDGRAKVGYFLSGDPPDAPPRMFKEAPTPSTYERIYGQYKQQVEIAERYSEAVMLENQRLRLEDEEMKERESNEHAKSVVAAGRESGD